ncbi:hypothetical protein FA10DRAFT_303005 [Acaromyces ingoldii]|uniref:Alpha/beta-hydrolase n=1 Tax=Acaromyces ingoldii TaxID=215250 RepID=A0A316YJI2_9BASI|nr:hypothetical protein FA10DRAFT_303005 [Acaromyces ingoldii]PWN89700.1 hypothetical protein FA10DRAFT_303005 [Acaromyces ingoldii]
MDTQLALALTPPLRASMLGAQCLVWPATAARTPSSPRLTLLFLPGNPGLADYYRGYLSELHRLVGPSLEIVCVSQLGHDPASAGFSLDTEPVVSLRRQIEHKEAILAALAGGTDRVILAGHSIGAYMALEIVRRRRTGPRIDSLHLLFPALHDMAQTPNARRLRLLLRAAAVSSSSSQRRGHSQEGQLTGALLATALSAIAWLLTLVPFFVVKFLILLASPTQGPEAIRATAGLLASRRAVRQCLGMACEEMDTVRTPAALGASSADGLPRIRAYWAAGDVDGWAPQSSRLYVERVLELQPHHLSGQSTTAAGTLSKRQKSFSIDEIRSARRRSKSQRLAGLVRAGASAGLAAARFGASYGLTSSTTARTAPRSTSNGGGSVRSRNPHANGSRPPVSPTRTRTAQRRPSLVAARASRRFDGSIVIEPDEVQAGADAVDLLAVDSDSDSDGDGDEDRTPTPRQGVAKDAMPQRASMVCNVGMPHAFVLEHSEQMARITAKWIIDDYALATPSASPSL